MAQETPRARLHPILGALLAIAAFALMMLLLGGFAPEVPTPPPGQFTTQVRSLIDDYANQFAGWRWARDNGVIQPVRAVCEQQHMLSSLSVEAVLADNAVTYVLFTVRGPDAAHAGAGIGPESTFNGKPARGLTIGTSHSFGGYAIGLVALDALPAGEGELSLQLYAGLCQNGCRVRFSLPQLPERPVAQTISLDKSMPLADGTLTINTLTLSPAQTVLRATWRGVAPSDASGRYAAVPRLLRTRAFSDEEPAQWGTRLTGPDGREVTRAFWGEDVTVAGSAGFVPDTPLAVEYTLVFDSLPPDLVEVTVAPGALVCIKRRTELPLATGDYVDAGGQPVTVTGVTVDGVTVKATVVEDYDVRSQKSDRNWQLLCTDGTIVQPTKASEYRQTTNATGTRSMTSTWTLVRGQSAQAIICPVYWTGVEAGDVRVGLR